MAANPTLTPAPSRRGADPAPATPAPAQPGRGLEWLDEHHARYLFAAPYIFEGVEYPGFELDFTKIATFGALLSIQRSYHQVNSSASTAAVFNSTTLSLMDDGFLIYVLASLSGQPPEFFERLPMREGIAVVTMARSELQKNL